MSETAGMSRINVALKALEKDYEHVIKWLGDAAKEQRETISTGCIGLDIAIGHGGFERGLIVEIFGNEGAGKSFLGYSTMLEACKKDYKCAIVDAENTLDTKLLVKLGLPEQQVIVADGAPTGEANLSIAHSLMETGEFAVVMIDSVAALVPEARVEGNYDDQTIGLHARLMSAGIQKIVPTVKRTNTLLIFINQMRNKIGSYGNPETTTGGKSLPFYASYRVEVKGGLTKSSRLTDQGTGEVYGHRTRFTIVKNKRSAPWREAEVDLIYGMGYDACGEAIDLGVDMGLIDKGGAWLTYGEHKWQGRDKAKLALQKDSSLWENLEREIRSVVSGEVFEVPTEPMVEEKTKGNEIKDDKPISQKRATKSERSAA